MYTKIDDGTSGWLTMLEFVVQFVFGLEVGELASHTRGPFFPETTLEADAARRICVGSNCRDPGQG